MSDLIKTLTKLASVHFTGKVNLLGKTDSGHLGVIVLKQGVLVQCRYNQKQGIDCLFEFFQNCYDKEDFYTIMEPETIAPDNNSFHLKVSELMEMKKRRKIYEEKLRPPGDLKLLVRHDFLSSAVNISPVESQLLKTILNHQRVCDIYQYVGMDESLVTRLLIGLRKKGALKVVD